MTTFRFSISLFAAASLAVGCASSGTAPSQMAADQFAGTWKLLSIQPAGQTEQATPAGADYTLTLTGDRVASHVDCNTCGGALLLSGQTVTVGPVLACTRAACETMAFENAFTTLLAGESTIAQTPGVLVLSSPRGVLRFAR